MGALNWTPVVVGLWIGSAVGIPALIAWRAERRERQDPLAIPICANCKFYRTGLHNGDNGPFCNHPFANPDRDEQIDIVSGRRLEPQPMRCDSWRRGGCGPEGHFYQRSHWFKLMLRSS